MGSYLFGLFFLCPPKVQISRFSLIHVYEILKITFDLGEPQVCYDMLGNATVPQSAPHVQLHSTPTTQPQFDMLGNPIGDSTPEPEQQPAVNENKINGINIVGVVNTESTDNQPEEKPGRERKNKI